MSHRHPIHARFYARTSPIMDRGLHTHRRTLLSGLTGRVIEIGAGNGLNFPHYPDTVTDVLAVEPEPSLRTIAETYAAQAMVPIKIIDGFADQLPTDDSSCEAAVASLVLCTVPDQERALAEISRVLKPGGQLHFLEHVQADASGRRRVQKTLDATVWPFLNGGCHCSRDTQASIEHAGFVIDRIDHLTKADTGVPFPASSLILGTATLGEGSAA